MPNKYSYSDGKVPEGEEIDILKKNNMNPDEWLILRKDSVKVMTEPPSYEIHITYINKETKATTAISVPIQTNRLL